MHAARACLDGTRTRAHKRRAVSVRNAAAGNIRSAALALIQDLANLAPLDGTTCEPPMRAALWSTNANDAKKVNIRTSRSSPPARGAPQADGKMPPVPFPAMRAPQASTSPIEVLRASKLVNPAPR